MRAGGGRCRDRRTGGERPAAGAADRMGRVLVLLVSLVVV